MGITTTDLALLRLLQMASVALPVGGYAFSQGMEYAIEAGWLRQRGDIEQWLVQQLDESLVRVDVPILLRQLRAASGGDVAELHHWNAWVLACRETRELRLADTAMGFALMRLANDLGLPLPVIAHKEISFVTAFALMAQQWQVGERAACHGLLWSWLENQVAAATKLLPLGQTAAQQLLGALLNCIPAATDRAALVVDEAIGGALPALAVASSRHEVQYSRLFRS